MKYEAVENRCMLRRGSERIRYDFRFVQMSITFIQIKAMRTIIVVNEEIYVQEDPNSPKRVATQSDKVSFDMKMHSFSSPVIFIKCVKNGPFAL